MDLPTALRRQLADFTAGDLSLAALQAFLTDFAEEIAGTQDPLVDRWASEAWLLLGECEYGYRTEASARETLSRVLGPAAAPAPAAQKATVARSTAGATSDHPGAGLRDRLAR